MKTKIACIGAGNMGSALMKGAAQAVGGKAIGFSDVDKAKAKAAAKALGGAVFESGAAAVKAAAYVFLAVKPQNVKEVLDEMRTAFAERAAAGNPPVLVSMAAGWTIAKLEAALGGVEVPAARGNRDAPIVRIMPNTPALVSRGMIALAASPAVSAAALAELETILGGAGVVDKIDEKLLDAVTGLSGSGPAFACLFIEALADGGVLAGLPRDKALRYAAQTVLGTAAMALETGKHPGELKDMVASPGGTTIAGIAALERGGFRGAVIQAVKAAWKRSLELA